MRLPILFLLFLLGFPLFSQEGMVRIDSISVEGNKKTHRAIILRELPFQSGDTIPLAALSGVLEEGERWLMNTGLFNRVDIFSETGKGVPTACTFRSRWKNPGIFIRSRYLSWPTATSTFGGWIKNGLWPAPTTGSTSSTATRPEEGIG
ncbi:MAG: hypothetical protein IPK21_01930 [Haliscomenobacter sp.]|nr:hypothetical protein [Haliscomenobacter sp.]